MSEKSEPFNPFDPTGAFKTIRDAGMDSWSKAMIQMVHTEEYARATGTMLDAWLTTSGPFRKALESALTQAVANSGLPTRADVIGLAERLTHIEMRLDDLEARLEETLHNGRPAAGGRRAGKAPRRAGNGDK
jgi:hypothetical protein